MSKNQIVKTENCPGCTHCAQNYVEDDELVILCDLEMDGYEEVEGEKCVHYSLVAFKKTDEPVDEGDQDAQVAFGSDDPDSGYAGGRKIVTARIRNYVFVGDKLSEIKNPKEGQEFVELDAAFADAWNLNVDRVKEDLSKQIEHLEASHAELLSSAKDKLLEGDFVVVQDLFEDEDFDDDDYEDDELDGDGPEDDDEAEDNPDDEVQRVADELDAHEKKGRAGRAEVEETVAKKSPAKKSVVKKSSVKKPATKKGKK